MYDVNSHTPGADTPSVAVDNRCLTAIIRQLLNSKQMETPTLVMDLEVISQNYQLLRTYLSKVEVYFSVKSNPDPLIMHHLLNLGASFEAASINELKQCLEVGALSSQLHFGNTIKSREAIEQAYQLEVPTFSFDAKQELDKIAAHAPGAKVIVRLKTDGIGANWGLTKKFGIDNEEAEELMVYAKELGLVPFGVSFHVGSQQSEPKAWQRALNNMPMHLSQY